MAPVPVIGHYEQVVVDMEAVMSDDDIFDRSESGNDTDDWLDLGNSSSDEELEELTNSTKTLRFQLAQLVIRKCWSDSDVTELLSTLKDGGVNVPLNKRTLIKVPREDVQLRTVEPEKYFENI